MTGQCVIPYYEIWKYCLPLPRAGYLRLQRLGKDFFVIYNAHFNAEQDTIVYKSDRCSS